MLVLLPCLTSRVTRVATCRSGRGRTCTADCTCLPPPDKFERGNEKGRSFSAHIDTSTLRSCHTYTFTQYIVRLYGPASYDSRAPPFSFTARKVASRRPTRGVSPTERGKANGVRVRRCGAQHGASRAAWLPQHRHAILEGVTLRPARVSLRHRPMCRRRRRRPQGPPRQRACA